MEFRSDDGTTELEPEMKTYGKLFREGGKVLGRPFFVRELQQQGLKEAGFVDIKTIDYKACMLILCIVRTLIFWF